MSQIIKNNLIYKKVTFFINKNPIYCNLDILKMSKIKIFIKVFSAKHLHFDFTASCREN